MRGLRPLQWTKNLLLAVPLLASHQANDLARLGALALGFVLFSTVASAGYVLNDLVDRKADRSHPRKRHRPFAQRALSAGSC